MENPEIETRIEQMIENMPSEVRQKISDHILKVHPEMAEAALCVLQGVSYDIEISVKPRWSKPPETDTEMRFRGKLTDEVASRVDLIKVSIREHCNEMDMAAILNIIKMREAAGVEDAPQ